MTASETAIEFLARLGAGAPATEVAELFSPDTEWNIPGDEDAFPWIGRGVGQQAVESFVHDTRRLLEPLRFNVEGIIADGDRAVILGSLASKVRRTGKTIETAFAIILTVEKGRIINFAMLEDSFAVSLSAKE